MYISNVDKTIIIEEKWIWEESVGGMEKFRGLEREVGSDVDALDSHVKFSKLKQKQKTKQKQNTKDTEKDSGENTPAHKQCWENWIFRCRKMKLDLCLSTTPKTIQGDQRP